MQWMQQKSQTNLDCTHCVKGTGTFRLHVQQVETACMKAWTGYPTNSRTRNNTISDLHTLNNPYMWIIAMLCERLSVCTNSMIFIKSIWCEEANLGTQISVVFVWLEGWPGVETSHTAHTWSQQPPPTVCKWCMCVNAHISVSSLHFMFYLDWVCQVSVAIHSAVCQQSAPKFASILYRLCW